MSDEIRMPVIEEEARILKRAAETEHVRVRTRPEEERVVVRDVLRQEHVDVVRVSVDREVAEAPAIRTEGEVTIVPVLEERLVTEKRLFLIEELHLRRSIRARPVEVPAVLRRTRVEIEREELNEREDD